MADHSKFAATANRLIAKHGRAITVQQLGGGTTDPAKPWLGQGAPQVSSAYNTKGAFIPASGSDLGQIVTNREMLASVEEVCLVGLGQLDIAEYKRVIDGSTVWKIEWVQVLKPGDTVCLYVLGLKR